MYGWIIALWAFAVGKAAAKVVREELTLTWGLGAPNGQPREMIFMNGQFPGPTFVWDEDDDVEVLIHNKMPFNTTIHWHGLLMQGTPWSDGVPGLTQKPIEAGESFMYRFKAYPSGTHWWHSHTRTTMFDGLFGAMYIRPKPTAPAPWSLISNKSKDIENMRKAVANPHVVVVSDWTRFKSWEYMKAQEDSGYTIFCVDSILINGKGSVYCPGEDFLVNHTMDYMKWAIYPRHVNDKGCLPFVKSTENKYLRDGRPETIPRHLQQGCVPSNGEQAVFEVDPADEWVSFNFVDAATFKTPVFAIDNHEMWVYEADGHFIEPQKVDTVKFYAGERYSVMVKLHKNAARDYTIRVMDTGLTQIIGSYATMRYKRGPNEKNVNEEKESEGIINYGGLNTTYAVTLDRDKLPPYPPNAPAKHADALFLLDTHRVKTAWTYTMKGGAMYQEDRSAYAPLLYHPNSADAMDESLVIRTKNNTWIDLVVQVGSLPNQPQEFPHIMHKHSGKTWQIGAGEGHWNYSSVEEAMKAEPTKFNLKTPNYRDTFITSFDGPSWIVLRYHSNNPGPWLMHCHFEIHLGGGMAIAFMDGIDAWPKVPPEYASGKGGFLD
ncbi:laccase-1 [Nannizzia gypsea CBS 118893]|uniref:Laccase-1 n=1 Tax=Arthroderma gypseum (strain ATCC MYA-4604 / CBS 118893) TaxID=535722 RepID=E4V6P8_ARTGP|nr:laccase-1 [Nannizzia gypsea CBS 118893]EFQ96764.1 laccase-1 [Nannizzia gypsea CBS 118893]